MSDDFFQQLDIKAAKQESFDASTAKEILRLLGWSKLQIAELQASYGRDIDCRDLDDLELPSGDVCFRAHREFSFNFPQFFDLGHRHPLAKAWLAVRQEEAGQLPVDVPLSVVMKVYDVGRIVLTNDTNLQFDYGEALPPMLSVWLPATSPVTHLRILTLKNYLLQYKEDHDD